MYGKWQLTLWLLNFGGIYVIIQTYIGITSQKLLFCPSSIQKKKKCMVKGP